MKTRFQSKPLISIALSTLLIASVSQASEPITMVPTPSTSTVPSDHVAISGQTTSLDKSLSIKDLIKKKKLDRMETQLRELVISNPDSSQAKSRLGAFLLSQNKAGESIPFYQDAITLNPEEPKLFAALSVAYLHQSLYSMAKAMADEALRLAPDMSQAKKLNEYIDAKQQVIEMAEKASSGSLTPDDSIHSKGSTDSDSSTH